jgi:cyclophilin family peptidyl-prolyl cis-trans isomerase
MSINSNVANASTLSTKDAEITSKIYIQLKGLPPPLLPNGEPTTDFYEDVITIGLYGKDAPQPVSILEQIVSSEGYRCKCKPKEIRLLQREQLEANKVYNSCIETEDSKGVSYDLSTVWRVVKDERIDLGAVSGKFVSREYPDFDGSNSFKHDEEGIVSVRRGNESGFGFTIYPGVGGGSNTDLDETNIVVGKVISGMDVVKRLNDLPVIQSSNVGYKGLAGGDPSKRAAPSRACRYGSQELYCNEFKPLKKVTIYRTGNVN